MREENTGEIQKKTQSNLFLNSFWIIIKRIRLSSGDAATSLICFSSSFSCCGETGLTDVTFVSRPTSASMCGTLSKAAATANSGLSGDRENRVQGQTIGMRGSSFLLWTTRERIGGETCFRSDFVHELKGKEENGEKSGSNQAKCKPLPALQTRRLFWTRICDQDLVQKFSSSRTLWSCFWFTAGNRDCSWTQLNSKAHCIRSCFPFSFWRDAASPALNAIEWVEQKA